MPLHPLQNRKNKENAEPTPSPFAYQSTIVCQDQDPEGSDEEDVHCIKPTARWPKIVRGKIQKNLNTWKFQTCEEEWSDNDQYVCAECYTCVVTGSISSVPAFKINLKLLGNKSR